MWILQLNLLQSFEVALLFLIVRYCLVGGIAYSILYRWGKRRFSHRKIQIRENSLAAVKKDFFRSLLGIVGLAIVSTVSVFLFQHGYLKVYFQVAERGVAYFLLSTIALIVLWDTYFYWAHRLIHLPRIYPTIHAMHHRSTNPTPLSIFAFNVGQAAVEGAFIVLAQYLLPLHPCSIGIAMFWMLTMNILGHSGFEFFPAGFVRHPVGKWINTSTHHNMHHQYVHYNFGLYFNFWDSICRTNHPRYIETYDSIQDRIAERQ